MNMRIEAVTPKKAKDYLAMNANNRPIDRITVNRLAQDMMNGRWMTSSQGIGFDTNGRLVDGQHRLMACVQANMPFTTMVVDGLEPSVFRVIDTHHKRTGGQIAGIAGVPNSNQAIGMVNAVLLFETCAGKIAFSHTHTKHISDTAKLQIIMDNADRVQRSVSIARNAYAKCPVLTPSLLGGLHYIVSQTKPELADEFVNAIGSGEGLMIGDPRLTLRNRLIERAAKVHKERFEWVAVLHIYAWNAFATGRTLKKLTWRSGDQVPALVR